MEDIRIQELLKHKKAFYLGSILPDCKPSFLTTKHEFNGTFEMLQKRIEALAENTNSSYDRAGAFMRNLGEVIHYIADYFTYPHNCNYEGTLKDHCFYEKELKFRLRSYITKERAMENKRSVISFSDTGELLEYIKQRHKDYSTRESNIQEDCEYIVSICYQVVQTVLQLVNDNIGKRVFAL